MAVSASSSAQQARQRLANRLAEMRRVAGLTGRDLARRCGWHPSKCSRIENARTPPSAEDIRVWCLACGAEEQTDDLVASLQTVEDMWIGWRRMERAGLRRAGIGGREIMAGQLGHLLTVGSLPHVSLGVVAMRPDREQWPVEGFWIYDASQVNVELVSGYLTLTEPSEVALYAETFAGLAGLAAYGANARALITSAADGK